MTPRLLKAIVQLVYVTEDGDGNLVEFSTSPTHVAAGKFLGMDPADIVDEGAAVVVEAIARERQADGTATVKYGADSAAAPDSPSNSR